MKARRPSSVSRQSLSRQPGPRCRCFILFCSVLTSTHRGRRGFLFVHVRPADLTGGLPRLSPVLRPPSLARKRPRTPASSTTRSHLQDRQRALRVLFRSLSFNSQTDKAHRASCSASHLQDRQGALRFLFGSSFTNNTDDVYCTSRSATPELTTRTARLVHQPTRPTARTARPVRLLPDRQRALRVQFGILIKGRPRALHVQLGI